MTERIDLDTTNSARVAMNALEHVIELQDPGLIEAAYDAPTASSWKVCDGHLVRAGYLPPSR
jgi:hypothetical protein